jgi:hypothetical protein
MSTPATTETRERFKAKVKIRCLAVRLRGMTEAERLRFVEGFMHGLRARPAPESRSARP